MKPRIFAIAVIFITFNIAAFTQKASIKNGIKAYNAKQYEIAYDQFNQSVIANAKIKDKEYSFIANAALYAKDYALASEFFEKMNEQISGEDMVNYARVLIIQEEYERAAVILSRAKEKGSKNPMIPNYLETCKFAPLNPTVAPDLVVTDARIEIDGPSWGTTFIDNSIVYSTKLKSPADQGKPNAYNYTDIAVANWKDDKASNQALLSSKLKFDYNDGGTSYSSSDNKLYFTHMIEFKKNKKKDYLGDVVYKIFETTKSGTNWSDPTSLSFNTPDFSFSCAYPAISRTGNVMVFSSDKPGGLGGYDLYVTYKTGGAWSEPENLGLTINTAGDELFPYMASNGSLFFASNGLPGYGELDLFTAPKSGKKWGKPTNLGKPYNSASNDFGYTEVPNSENTILISTNRTGEGLKDRIYIIKKVKPEPEEIKIVEIPKDTVKAVVNNATPEKFETEVILSEGDNQLPEDMGLTYRIQVMATKRPIDTKSKLFKGLSIERNMHNNLYKYTAGDFPKMDDAEKYRLAVVKMGFTDAFMVSFAGEYRNKTYIPGDNNATPPKLNSQKKKDSEITEYFDKEGLVYRVQFKSTKNPLDKVSMNIDGQYVFRYEYKGLFRYTIGEFETPSSAIELKNRIVKELGYKDAFVVAFNKDNERVTNVKIYK